MSAEFVAPEIFGDGPSWAPAHYSGAGAVALRAGHAGRPLGELGEIIEGWRVSATPAALDYDPRAADIPIYRQGNIQPLRLQLEREHWASPGIEGRWCVRPGDVVLNKASPVRAAIVSPAARRHPVDGNTLIIRGLSRSDAAWVALCLNHPGYERLVLLGTGVFDRVGTKALAALRVPPAPPEMDGLSAHLSDTLDDATLVGEALHRVHSEADEFAGAAPTKAHPLRTGVCFPRDNMAHDSWLPSHTALRAEQAVLAADLGWVAIGELSSWDARVRLTEAPEGARALHVRDVGEDLLAAPVDADEALDPRRTLATHLVPGEVLLSTLGTSFRAAYVDDDVPKDTFATDRWVRVRFRETPAAWALLLSTDALRSQAARLAIGSVQQFVPPESLPSMRVPVPPREVRDRWQRAVERHHAQRRRLDLQWTALVTQMNASFESAHRPFGKSQGAKESVR